MRINVMRHQLVISGLLIAAFGTPAAMADLITDTINFTGFGLLPTEGMFTYDTVANTFTAFTVTWNAFPFDLKSSANAPTASGCDTTGCTIGDGFWSTAPTSPVVPEPSSLILISTTLLAAAFVARKRIAQQMLLPLLSAGGAISGILKPPRITRLFAIATVLVGCTAAGFAQQPCDVGQCPFLAQCNFSGTWQGFITLDLTQSGAALAGTVAGGNVPVTGSVLYVYTPSNIYPPTIQLQVGSDNVQFGISDCNHWVQGEDSSGLTGLTLTKTATCDLGLPGSLGIFPSAPDSYDKKPTVMTATFSPTTMSPLGIPIPTTLAAAAQACGYTGFNFQQVTNKFPGNFYGNVAPFVDPPQSIDPAAYPYYYSAADFTKLCIGGIPIMTANTLHFCDQPKDSNLGLPFVPNPGNEMAFETSLVGLSLTNPLGVDILAKWFWTSTYNSLYGGVNAATLSFTDGAGTGGVTITSINGVQLNPLLSGQIVTTASGLAYSRVSRTFNGTVRITNLSSSSLSGPFQVVFMSLTTGVTVANQNGWWGNPVITVPGVTTLGPGQSATVSVQFKNPSNATINFTPAIYSGSLN